MPPPLGSKQIEGIEAGGMRRTETIPAGRIGNDRPIVVTDERWESPELKLIMLSEHHDPRTGDVEYRLTNVSRAEPPHDLFTVPPDYKIVDAPPPPPPPPPPPGRPDQPL
ncbi:MAG: hypothetical protein LAO77_02610 [Acidobacteriia bacterium]|nr:hypothetical protein [Terriglobia bacterium]